MKNLYLIGGTMGVGNTTVCQSLKMILKNSVFLDGDWCWDAYPFQVNDETKNMVIKNICYLLNNFIECSCYDNVIFCWVMHEQNIIDSIISKLNLRDCNIKVISLICDDDILKNRLLRDIQKGIRTDDIIKRSIERIPLYSKLNTIKIDTSNKDIINIVNEISNL